MRLRSLFWVAAAALILPALGCGKGRSTDEILIGEYGSLTGGIATFGISTKNGSTMAFDEINGAGGVLGKKFKLLVEDDQSKPEEAGTVVTKLINQNHVVAILGQVASSHSLAAAPICQANKIPMVSPSSTNPRVTQVGDYIFRVCFIDPFQGAVMAKFAANTLKAKKVAILVDVRSDYSVGLQTFFREQFKQLGGQIVSEQSYSQGDSDFRAQLTQIKLVQKFVGDYKARFKEVPDALAALGYDAAKILADAMSRAGSTDGPKVHDALAATKDFPGVTGKITINKDRNAVKPAVVLKVENGKFVYVETVTP